LDLGGGEFVGGEELLEVLEVFLDAGEDRELAAFFLDDVPLDGAAMVVTGVQHFRPFDDAFADDVAASGGNPILDMDAEDTAGIFLEGGDGIRAGMGAVANVQLDEDVGTGLAEEDVFGMGLPGPAMGLNSATWL
jgi:hypothetical protein